MYTGTHIHVEIQANNDSISSEMSVVCDEFCKTSTSELISKYFSSAKIPYTYCGII